MIIQNFIALNEKKIRVAFIISSIVCLGFVSVLFIYETYKGHPPELDLILYIILMAGIIFPLFLVFLSFMSWQVKTYSRQRAFKKSPFDQLNKLGFIDYPIYEKSKWIYTEEIKKGKIKDFYIFCDKEEAKPIIIFTAGVYHETMESKSEEEFNKLKERFDKQGFEMVPNGIVKRYNLKKLTVHSIEDLKKDLEAFTEILLQEGFKPLSK